LGLTPHDQERFTGFVARFIADCEIALPFHVITISANGAVAVARYSSESGVEEVCATPGPVVAPITVTVVGADATSRSAKITVEAARRTVQ
jgi:hypothetical protein